MAAGAKRDLSYFTIPDYPGPKPAGIDGLYPPFAVQDVARLKRGERVGPQLLAGKTVPLSKKYGNQLADFLYSLDGAIVASERAKAFFEAQDFARDEVEYVPLRLKGKKGQPRMPPYWVVNPLRKVACLDPKRSECHLFTNPVNGKQRWTIETLKIDESKVPRDARLFRLGEEPKIMLVRSDLLEAIRAAGLTGLKEQDLGESLYY